MIAILKTIGRMEPTNIASKLRRKKRLWVKQPASRSKSAYVLINIVCWLLQPSPKSFPLLGRNALIHNIASDVTFSAVSCRHLTVRRGGRGGDHRRGKPCVPCSRLRHHHYFINFVTRLGIGCRTVNTSKTSSR